MEAFKQKFVNERGQKIFTQVKNTTIKEDRNKYPGVTYTLKGPESTTSHTLTMLESKSLNKGLVHCQRNYHRSQAEAKAARLQQQRVQTEPAAATE